MKKALGVLLFTLVLVVSDYLLFRGYELVFPFFLLPYILVSLIYLIYTFKTSERFTFESAVCLIVIIPVYAGLVMCLAWTVKINFWGELVGGYLIR